jgi:hypothetical protein
MPNPATRTLTLTLTAREALLLRQALTEGWCALDETVGCTRLDENRALWQEDLDRLSGLLDAFDSQVGLADEALADSRTATFKE